MACRWLHHCFTSEYVNKAHKCFLFDICTSLSSFDVKFPQNSQHQKLYYCCHFGHMQKLPLQVSHGTVAAFYMCVGQSHCQIFSQISLGLYKNRFISD